MNNLLGISINKKYRTLEVQECEFQTNANGLIEIKAPVGSGKTSMVELCSSPITGKDGLKSKLRLEDELDVERQLTYKGETVFIHIRKKAGSSDIDSKLYIKDARGNKVPNPMIDGIRATPATFIKLMNTDLTYGIDRFLSSDPRIQLEFMCGKIESGKYRTGVYSDKMHEVGIILDTKSPDYVGSVLYRLEQARAYRQEKYQEKRRLNAFKESLEEEGYDENNIPEWIDLAVLSGQINEMKSKVSTLEAEIRAINEDNTKKWYEDKSKAEAVRQAKVSALKDESNKYMAVINAYNAALSTESELRAANLKAEIDKYMTEEVHKVEKREDMLKSLGNLRAGGYAGQEVSEWIDTLPKAGAIRDFETELAALPELNEVPMDNGKVAKGAYAMKFTKEVDEALIGLSELRHKVAPLMAPQEETEAPEKLLTDGTGNHSLQVELSNKIAEIEKANNKAEIAKETNLISERWVAFKEHQKADYEVQKIYREYQSMFKGLDLGIEGLSMELIGKEGAEKIVTMYDGSHNPELFFNPNKEKRILCSEYSETQKTVIAILMQAYLLEEKRKKGEEGLDMMWIESPLDNKTRDLLVDLQKRYGLTLIANTTGDYEELKDGMYTIKNGHLLCNL